MRHPYEVTAFVERGWWLVHAVDVGAQVRVSTLAEVESAARELYARRLGMKLADVAVTIQVYRSSPAAVIRARWTGRVRR